MFTQVLFLPGKHNLIWFPSMPPHHLSLIFMRMKQILFYFFLFFILNWWNREMYFFFSNWWLVICFSTNFWGLSWMWLNLYGCQVALSKVISGLKRPTYPGSKWHNMCNKIFGHHCKIPWVYFRLRAGKSTLSLIFLPLYADANNPLLCPTLSHLSQYVSKLTKSIGIAFEYIHMYYTLDTI